MSEFLEKIENKVNLIGEWVYRYRFVIAICLFLICVIFELSGSSIGAWNSFINSGNIENTIIFGQNRNVRSDEWAVLTPMMFSQKFDGFHWFSNILRGGNTDVFLIYGLPVLNLMQIFRPFQIGFLFLGLAKGLSFFWFGRLILLFVVSFEFGMLISNKRKLLSLTYAILATFSPIIQWWFAVNGTVEIILFGELAILLLDKYLLDNEFKHRIIYLIGAFICAGGYLMVFYPAWQVPSAYVFLFIAIWIFIKDWKQIKISRRDIVSIAIILIVFILCMTYILVKSYDTLKIILSTVYPGNRTELGGHRWDPLYRWVYNIFLPYKDVLLVMDQTTASAMFSVFPLGLIVGIYNLIRNKEKDKLTICLMIADAILLGYAILGFPSIIAKISMLSRTTAYRVYYGIGFLDLVLLLRSLSINEKSFRLISAAILSIVLSCILVYNAKMIEYQYITKNMMAAMLIMCVYLFFFGFRISTKYSKLMFCSGCIFVMIMSGMTVNPIRHGVKDIIESPILNKVREINNNESGMWLVTDLGYPIPDYMVMAGVPIINSTNTYPDLDKWKQFDPDGKYEEVYNRYAHIMVYIVDSEDKYINEVSEGNKDKMYLQSLDTFKIYLLPDEVKKLGVDYIFTIQALENFNTEKTSFEKLDEVNGYFYYKVSYKD